MKKKLEVVGAIIIEDGKLLSAMRGECKNTAVAYKYEFVGGKIEQGELGEQALMRELVEEMDMTVQVLSHFMTVIYEYQMYIVTLHSYLCKRLSDFVVKEHIRHDWLTKQQINFDLWAPADKPILDALIQQNLL